MYAIFIYGLVLMSIYLPMRFFIYLYVGRPDGSYVYAFDQYPLYVCPLHLWAGHNAHVPTYLCVYSSDGSFVHASDQLSVSPRWKTSCGEQSSFYLTNPPPKKSKKKPTKADKAMYRKTYRQQLVLRALSEMASQKRELNDALK